MPCLDWNIITTDAPRVVTGGVSGRWMQKKEDLLARRKQASRQVVWSGTLAVMSLGGFWAGAFLMNHEGPNGEMP